ncbi:MAG: hypothetical protein ACI3Y7_02755 [Candidatus Cryptobacteroides sp.]
MAFNLAAILVSCNVQDVQEPFYPGDKSFEIHALTSSPETAATKTIMDCSDDSGPFPVLWQTGDKVGIGSGASLAEYELSSGAGQTEARFTGPEPSDVGGTGMYASVYPVSGASVSLDGSRICANAVLASNQTYESGSFANGLFPMTALSLDGLEYSYTNLCGILQLQIKGTGTIKKIKLFGNDGEILAGSIGMYYNASDGSIIASGAEEENGVLLNKDASGSRSINLTFGAGLVLDPENSTTVNIVMFPTIFEEGFTLNIYDSGGGAIEKETTAKIIVGRSKAKRMKEFDYQSPDPLETANSYIVDKAGYTLIPAYCMGNRQSGSERFPIDENGYTTSGNRVSADILWTDIVREPMDLPIEDIQYVPGAEGRILFKVKKDPETGEAYRGNAVIALYEEDDKGNKTIIWTWHIWLTEEPGIVLSDGACDGRSYTTAGITFSSDAASGTMEIMDRNLGAISANPEDGWKTYGLYYQMGRKDPFVGGDYNLGQTYTTTTYDGNLTPSKLVYVNEDTPFGSGTARFWYNIELANGFEYQPNYINITYSIQHPMVFSDGQSKPFPHVWTNCLDSDNMSYMDGVEVDGVKRSTGLTNDGHEAYWNRTKTIFDPCPAGWTVLGEGKGKLITGDGKSEYVSDGVSYGLKYTCNYNTIWWPFAGVRAYDGKIGNVGVDGAYINYDHINADHGWHGMDLYNKTMKTVTIHSNHAASVRCVRAKQTYGSK